MAFLARERPGRQRHFGHRSQLVGAGLCLGLCFIGGAATGCTGKGAAPGEEEREQPEPQSQAEQDVVAAPPGGAAPSNGFSDDIAWWPLQEGLDHAKKTGHPLMLVVHASWCDRCKELKPAFADDELVELSRQFVMVNVDQDQERKSMRFAPDGDYVPRVLFVDPKSGFADPSLRNERRSRNYYFYTPQDDLLGVMKKALARHGST